MREAQILSVFKKQLDIKKQLMLDFWKIKHQGSISLMKHNISGSYYYGYFYYFSTDLPVVC
jgi:hypothetical protein